MIEEGAQYALAEDKNVKTAVENRLKSIMSVFEKGKRTERNWYKSQRILAGAILGGLISHEASEASHAVSGAVHHTELYQKMFGSHISDSEIHSPTEHSIKNIPHAPAVKVPESVHGFEVKFSSQGLGKTIETFKASSEFKNLPPEIQEAFKGSPMKVAEKLHGFLPKGNESVTVGPGSEFGVNEKGEIFLTDTHHPGEVHILGKLENGKIEVPEKTDLKYIHSKDAVSAEDKPSHAHVAGSGETEDDIPSHPNVAGSAETHDDIPSHARVAGSRLDIPNEDDAPSHAKVSGGTPKKAPDDMFSNENTTPNTTAHRGAPTEGTPNAVEKPSSSGIPANTEDIVQKTHGETKNVLYYIFSKNPDVDQAKVWTDLKEFKASAWFQTDYSDLSKAKTNTGIKIDLWAYMRALRLNTGIEVDGDETTEHYINRAGEAFVKENPSKTLDAIYELSQKYLDDVKRSQ